MNETIRIIVIIFLVFLVIFVITFAVNIIPKQLSFIEECKDSCESEGMDYSTKFNSRPWSKVNGKCYCIVDESTLKTENMQEKSK